MVVVTVRVFYEMGLIEKPKRTCVFVWFFFSAKMSVDQRTGHRLFLSLLPSSEPLTTLPSACLLRLSGHGAELIFVVRSAKCECLTPYQL